AYHTAMCSFREKKWEDTIRELASLLEDYPETGRAGEALYHMGICYLNLGRVREAREYFLRTVHEFPDEVWARFANDRLREMQTR
ncbi:MAG: tetratricopeptide repeat protein, partial [Proteobacteria bacterium]|nr:tetratricopeptide repeat protein [Pseudomonadota bacterium]